jgi:2,4-dienoyl-CoA reductase-like NADH-dependent reductase (Old Yellow Enzyme family)
MRFSTSSAVMIETALRLPCGQKLPNRLCKAAMTEGLATAGGVPTKALIRLYRVWSDSGAGLLLSGNVQIDRDHLERPGNVIVDREPDDELRAALAAWARAGTSRGNHFWAQISHAGRQTQKLVNPHPRAPSAVQLGLPGGQFGEPVPMSCRGTKISYRCCRPGSSSSSAFPCFVLSQPSA